MKPTIALALLLVIASGSAKIIHGTGEYFHICIYSVLNIAIWGIYRIILLFEFLKYRLAHHTQVMHGYQALKMPSNDGISNTDITVEMGKII